MRLLLDSHVLIWAVEQPDRLSSQAKKVIEDTTVELLVSAGSIWEISIKVGLGKLTLSRPFVEWMTHAVNDMGATILPVSIEHANAQIALPFHHRDPFDRLLAAQSKAEALSIASADSVFDLYGISRVW